MTTEYLPTADGYRKVDDDDTTTSTPQKTAGVQTTTTSSTAANSPAAVLEGDEATKARKAAAAGKQKKKRTSAYRRRLRRKGQREEPTLTRLAAVLGQIKEACADQDEVNSKIAPLIESATRMIEALSENQKKSGADVQKKGREAQSSDDTVQADNNSTSAAKMSSPTERGVVAGSRIPPHVYRPTVAGPTTSSRQQWQRGPVLSSRMMIQPPPMKPPMRNTAIVNKEAVQREMQKSELRTRLRSCRTIEDFQAALNEAERLGLTHEATAARNHINKLMATTAA